jgi:predicted phage terminase large subunit-like protein
VPGSLRQGAAELTGRRAGRFRARRRPAQVAEAKARLGSYGYSAQHQQEPLPGEGVLFQRAWFPIVAAAPRVRQRVRYWDKAATQDGGDYSAGVLMAKSEAGQFYVEDVTRGQWSALKREAVIEQTAHLDAERGRTTIWVECEPGSGGKESAELTVRRLAGFPVHAERVTGDKVTRARPLAAQAEAGNVFLVKGPWNRTFLDELCAFPYARHDDQVDAAAGAFNKLALKRKIKCEWEIF